MKIFKNKEKKQEEDVILDKDGNPVKPEKKIEALTVLKKVAIGVGCVVVGVVTFIAVGAAMAICADTDEDKIDIGEDTATETPKEELEANPSDEEVNSEE